MLIISGPFIVLGGFEFNIFASSLAINVLPVPGGPYKSKPLTCDKPYFFKKLGEYLLEANALLNI